MLNQQNTDCRSWQTTCAVMLKKAGIKVLLTELLSLHCVLFQKVSVICCFGCCVSFFKSNFTCAFTVLHHDICGMPVMSEWLNKLLPSHIPFLLVFLLCGTLGESFAAVLCLFVTHYSTLLSQLKWHQKSNLVNNNKSEQNLMFFEPR